MNTSDAQEHLSSLKAGLLNQIQSDITVCVICTPEDYAKHHEGLLKSLPYPMNVAFLQNRQGKEETYEIAGTEKIGGHNVTMHRYQYTGGLDFSKLKNKLLKMVKSKWVLFLDADDRLCANKGQLDLSNYPDDVVAVKCLVNSLVNGKVQTIGQYKLFRNDIGIKFVGAVHEDITPTIPENKRIATSCISIEHTGYSNKTEYVNKAYRNVEIILREGVDIEDRRTQWHLMNHLMTLAGAGYYDGALDV